MEQRPPFLIDTLEKLDDALKYWKNITFSQHYLKLDDVVESLRQPHGHLVDARQEYAARWVLCPPGGKKPATMWTVGVWRWNSDLDTGNFVPPGESAPARLPETRIQTIPNNMCRYTYAFDTTYDKTFWEAQTVFEEHIQNINKFNPTKKLRREFQNGVTHTHTFHLNAQMFVKRSAYTRTREASRTYPLHNWLKSATKKGMPFFANDEKPMMFELDEEGGLRPLSECYPPTLRVGDLVWVSLAAEFFIGNMNWSTNFIPFEFVRLGSVALELLPDVRKALDEDEDEEGPREHLGSGMRGLTAAEARNLNDVAAPHTVAHAMEPADIATEPNTGLMATEAGPDLTPTEAGPDLTAIEVKPEPSNLTADDPEGSRNFLSGNLGRPRSPHAFIDSESEECSATSVGNDTDDDQIDSGTHPDDDDSTTQDFMSVDDNFIVNDNDNDDSDSSLTDVPDETLVDSPALDGASVAKDSLSAAGGDASVVALVSMPVSIAKIDNRRANDPKPPPKTSKKRPASSERVLRKRIAKGKGVDRS